MYSGFETEAGSVVLGIAAPVPRRGGVGDVLVCATSLMCCAVPCCAV